MAPLGDSTSGAPVWVGCGGVIHPTARTLARMSGHVKTEKCLTFRDACLTLSTMTAGELLREWREQNEITRRMLAAELEITERQIARWEAGESRPSWEMAVEIERICSIEIGLWATSLESV